MKIDSGMHVCFAILLLANLGLLTMCSKVSAQTQIEQRPNIIIILADDLGYSDLGCYGGEIPTPNLDRLASGGVQFRNFYNATRCCPSRASLLTGLYPHEAGMGGMVSSPDRSPKAGPYQGYLNEHSVTIAEVLKPVGYKTYMSGKWHVGERPEHWPLQRGFDQYFGLISGASSYFELIEEPRRRVMAHQNDPWYPPKENFYMTEAFTDTAVAYLQHHHQHHQTDPFLLYVAYTAPHWPLHALADDIKKFEGAYDEGWDIVRRTRFEKMRQDSVVGQQYVLSPSTSHIPKWESTTNRDEWKTRMEVYAAMVHRMDMGIGRLVATLEKQGKLDNTLIIFLSDNGASAENIDGRNLNDPCCPVGFPGSYVAYDEPWANVSNTPFTMYKSWTEEGGIVTPFIAHWPNMIHKPHKTDVGTVGHIIDIMATCIDISGATYPTIYAGKEIRNLRGRSLVPVFRDGAIGERTLYWEHLGKWAIRDGNWKLIGDGEDELYKLYNLESDPVELHNVGPENPAVVEQLRTKYEIWSKEVGVSDD